MQAALARYGRHLGTAYQLIDDVLDYQSDPPSRGKNLGDDLAEGKPTLPLIHALRSARRRRAGADPRGHHAAKRTPDLERIIGCIDRSGGIEYTARAGAGGVRGGPVCPVAGAPLAVAGRPRGPRRIRRFAGSVTGPDR